MTVFLVNGVYPPNYFDLNLVDKIEYPNKFWWASKHRYATVDPEDPTKFLDFDEGGDITSEILEIDLGRVRQINYLNFDIVRMPINVTVQYDAYSGESGTHQWQSVTPHAHMPFDRTIYYDAKAKNPLFNADFYFTDSRGRIVKTRYLRLIFSRRRQKWPTKKTKPFRFPVVVKNLRTARYVTNLYDTVGPLITNNISGTQVKDLIYAAPRERGGSIVTPTVELKQRFQLPEEVKRGSITPSMLGFSFLVDVNPEFEIDEGEGQPKMEWEWKLFDVTDGDDPTKEPIAHGIEAQEITRTGPTWVDILFERRPVDSGTDRVYEMRVKSMNAEICHTVYTHKPIRLPGVSAPGTYTFTNSSATINFVSTTDPGLTLKIGDYIRKKADADTYVGQILNISYNAGGGVGTITLTSPWAGSTGASKTLEKVYPMYMSGYDSTRSLACKVWGDVGDEGRDVLGNQYRYAVLREKAKYVLDDGQAGWLSAPQPSPNAVESLFFDVRADVGGQKVAQVIDAVRMAPRTPGIHMHIYYSNESLNGRPPDTLDEWNSLVWTPLHQLYVLKTNAIFELPQQIKASYIKLEFTNLRPLPFDIPTYPPLPPVTYRRYPTWVETQFFNPNFNGYQRIVEDWFTRNKTGTMKRVLKAITGEDEKLLEFQYKQREFLAALALGRLDTLTKRRASQYVDVNSRALIDPVTQSKIYFATRDMYKGTLVATVDRTSILGQVVAETYDSTVPGDPVEGEVNYSNLFRTPNVSTVQNRIQQAYAHLTNTPMWFNRKGLHYYMVEQAKFNKKAYFAGIREVTFMRNDYSVLHDDPVIEDILHDEEMLSFNTFIPDEETVIPEPTVDGDTFLPNAYITYEVDGQTITDEPLILAGFEPEPLSVSGVASRIVVRSAKFGLGDLYHRGEDYDITFTTAEDGSTLTNINRSNVPKRLAVSRSIVKSFVYQDGDIVTGVGSTGGGDNNEDYGVVTGAAVVSGVEVTSLQSPGTVTGVAVPQTTLEEKVWEYGGTATGQMQLYVDYSAVVMADNPVSYWKLDESSGPTATDSA